MKQLVQETKQCKRMDSKDSVVTAISCTPYRKYNKITQTIRNTFLNLIINGNTTIKKSAKLLNINYSSAKTIVSEFKKEAEKKFKQIKVQAGPESGFRKIQKEGAPKITLITTIGSINTCEKQMFEDLNRTQTTQFTYNISSVMGYCV